MRVDDTGYVWLDGYVYSSPNDEKECLKNEVKISIVEVWNSFHWVEFLNAASPVFNINFYQSIIMIAGAPLLAFIIRTQLKLQVILMEHFHLILTYVVTIARTNRQKAELRAKKKSFATLPT